MKYFIGLLSIVLLFASCSKDDKSNDPEINLGDLIIDQTVTSAGADLVSGDFSLSIPEGTFSAATPVKISKLVETPFSSDAVSPLYFLTDLPPSSGQPMEVKLSGLDLSQPLTVFFAEVTHVKSLDSTLTVYRKIEHLEIDGKIVVTIPRTPSIYQKSNAPSDEKLTIGVMVAKSQQSLTSSGGHFNLTFPASKASQASTVASYLEEAYTTFNSPPFSFDYSNRTSWPMSVTLYPMDNTLYGEQVSSAWGDNYASISINSEKLNEMPEIRVTAGHEFFHFVQSLYDPRSGFSKAKFASPHYWFDEAVAVWSEEYFTDVSGYTSKARAGNELAPFEGGLNDSKPDARGYGYGMSTAVKHMVAKYGVEKIKVDL
ncbi:MAG: hypothetical protein IPH84_15815 [Bacteroidales bacterium]|nr:hypothetical protein [Bacteroidales bacterium]